MIPGFSRNCRRTSSTTPPPARPTDSIERAAKRYTIMPPIRRPISTSGCEMSNEASVSPSLVASSRSSSMNAANRTSAASTADPIAYPFVTAFVVLPTASSGSVTPRTSSGRSAISAIPPALSVIGPKASSATIRPVSDSCAITATPIP
jgi:hypothetical protein